MRDIINKIVVLLLMLLLWGCNDPMTEPTEIIDIRVMGIKMDNPEVKEGGAVAVESLIARPYNKQDIIYTEGWLVCDPKGKDGINTCQNFSGENLYYGPVIDSNSFSFNIGAGTVMDGAESHILYIIHFVCEDTLENCTSMVTSGDQFDITKVNASLKRLRVVPADQTVKNHNPEIKTVYMNGEPITGNTLKLKADTTYTFKAMIDESDIEKKPHPEKGEVDELITFSWATDLGEMAFRYTDQIRGDGVDDLDDNEFETPKNASDGPFYLYLTVFDGRGGVDWRVFEITLE